jgi:mono/diheme cytochrome c family protein
MRCRLLLPVFAAIFLGLGTMALAQEQASSSDAAPLVHTSPSTSPSGAPKPPAAASTASASTKPASVTPSDQGAMRVEGEKRFRTNCGRCHMAPRKFPPRTMAAIVRHMRVRAMITDEDMKLILAYMTQ